LLSNKRFLSKSSGSDTVGWDRKPSGSKNFADLVKPMADGGVAAVNSWLGAAQVSAGGRRKEK